MSHRKGLFIKPNAKIQSSKTTEFQLGKKIHWTQVQKVQITHKGGKSG